MRLRIQATNFLEWLGLRSGQAPLPMGDVWLAVFQARAIMAAVRLRIFEALAGGACTASTVAERTALHQDTVEMLLRLLACTPYVTAVARGYALTANGRRFLTAGSPQSLVGLMELMYLNLEWFQDLEQTLATGSGVDMHRRLQGEQQWKTYQEAMREAARLQASRVAPHVPLPRRAERLLDLGGAHGLFGAAICRRRDGMRSEVIDLATALPSARRMACEEGVADIVTHRAGDVRSDQLGADFDVVFVGNLLHHFQPDENRALLRRAHAASRAGATLAIWDLERPEGVPDLIGDGMALLFRVTSGAAVYPARDHVDWLHEAGYERVRVRRFLTAPGQVLMTGRRS